jgi:hypothetical protein
MFLNEHHRCVGLWRRRGVAVGFSAAAMLGGAILSTTVLYLVSDRPSVITVAIGVLSGAILGQAVLEASRH